MIYKRLLYGSSLVVFLLISQLALAQQTVDFSGTHGFGIPEQRDRVRIENILLETIIPPDPFAKSFGGEVRIDYLSVDLKACETEEGIVYLEPILSEEIPPCIPSGLNFSASYIDLVSFDSIQFNNIQRTESDQPPLSLEFKYDPHSVQLVQVTLPQKITISLNWGENPRDLDAHLTGPTCVKQDEFDASCDLNNRFHVYFRSSNADIAFMDIGEFSETKPETIVIYPPYGADRLRPGLYRYVVHHFSGIGSIETANAEVRLKIGKEPERLFYPPKHIFSQLGGEYDAWVVFELIVTPEGSVEVYPKQDYVANVNPIMDIF